MKIRDFDLDTSHVLPALLRKAHEAKARDDRTLTVWGSGTTRREFLYADDLADTCVHLMEVGYDGPLVNIGSRQDITADRVLARSGESPYKIEPL